MTDYEELKYLANKSEKERLNRQKSEIKCFYRNFINSIEIRLVLASERGSGVLYSNIYQQEIPSNLITNDVIDFFVSKGFPREKISTHTALAPAPYYRYGKFITRTCDYITINL